MAEGSIILLQVLRARGIEYIVAPYEADAQMALLAAEGLVHAVITEDSDLVPHACPRVSVKFHPFSDEAVAENDTLCGSTFIKSSYGGRLMGF